MSGLGEIGHWKEEDIPKIAELEKICFSEPWSILALKEGFENPSFQCWVFRIGEEVAGYLNAMLVFPEVMIANLATAPEFRKQGVAERLILAMTEELSKSGFDRVTLEVRPSNSAAKSLYKKLGFVKEGRRKNFYSDGEDAEILLKLI